MKEENILLLYDNDGSLSIISGKCISSLRWYNNNLRSSMNSKILRKIIQNKKEETSSYNNQMSKW